MTNEEYEEARNKLIPFAKKHANKKVGETPKSAQSRIKWSILWNQIFLGEMDRLARKMGLIN